MCEIAEILFFFIRGKTYFTYIFVGSIKSSPKLRFEDLYVLVFNEIFFSL